MDVYQLALDGMTLVEIAKHTGLHRQTVHDTMYREWRKAMLARLEGELVDVPERHPVTGKCDPDYGMKIGKYPSISEII